MPAREATIFIVDDDPAIRQSLEKLVKSIGLPVATYRSAAEFLEEYRSEWPGCLVLDVRMPGMSGLELQHTMRERGLEIPTIIITGHGDVPVAVRALKDGASEFLEKPFSSQMLLEYIRDALKRDGNSRMLREKHREVVARMATLTDRERRVMELVVAGKVNKEIAAELNLSKKTVEVHRAHVMKKLQVETLAELVERVVTSRLRATTPSAPAN
jgi:RNA polymerase sigma factor (sigma-70 family)